MDRRRTDSEANASKLRILAVDDDSSYLRYLQLVLARCGYDVEVAPDGQAALERLRKGDPFDLLVIDLAMPGMDGIETVRHIQQDATRPLYTILLTARDAVETKLRALNSGLDDFVSKTSSESEIIAKIRSAARRLELERRLQALAMTDELTGIANRRALFLAGEELIRTRHPVTVVLLDLDQFKVINDTLGHLAGDRILAGVAAILKENTRYADVVGRYGGDEFLLLLAETDLPEARQIAERILSRIRQMSVGAQVGIATATTTLAEAIAVCDQAMYRGKRGHEAGRDLRT